jgi:NAD(P)-dependent dehydrogenase (short-subunit alcohol dehydrogenase family)
MPPTFDTTAVVTGAGSGIGAATARRLALEGTRVVLVDINEEGGKAVAQEIGGTFIAASVADNDTWPRIIDVADGTIELAHLNAGVVTSHLGYSIEDVTPDLYRRLMTTNIDGVVFGIQALVPGMAKKGRGAIVVTSSLAGLVPLADDPLYSATKHALIGLVRSLAPQLAAKGITINAICPGSTDTGLVDFLGNRPQAARLHLMDPAEVADAVVACLLGTETGKAYTVLGGRGHQEHEFLGLS